MKTNNRQIKDLTRILLLVFLFASQFLAAQPGFDDDVVDEPAAPINTYLIYLGIIALGIAFYVINKKKNKIVIK